jgi:DNA-directed RNA polymerase specialized sigma24 family protein
MEIKWEGAVQAFTLNFTKRNLFRLRELNYEFNDLYHDCWIKFTECKGNFKGENIAQFIAFYRTSLNNMITDLQRRNQLEFEAEEMEEDIPINDDFKHKIVTAPKPIQDVLRFIYDETTDLEPFKTKAGFSNNKLLCKMLGYNPRNINLVSNFKKFFMEV